MAESERRKVFFGGLTELRGVAASLVVLSHVEMHANRHGAVQALHHVAVRKLLFEVGHLSVRFFFCLSGFLITYLLLTEQRREGGIRIRDFYVRRVLRIWPPYFTVVLTAIVLGVVVPEWLLMSLGPAQHHNYLIFSGESAANWTLALYLLFAINLAPPGYPLIFAWHAWSVCVEEQFYLLWPWVVRLCWRRLLLVGLIIVTAYALLGPMVAELKETLDPDASTWSAAARTLCQLFSSLHLDHFAAGAVVAALLRAQPKASRRILGSKVVCALLGLFVCAQFLGVLSRGLPMTVGMSVLIGSVGVVASERLRVPGLFTLGTISYGVYMYHPLAISLALWGCKRFGHEIGTWAFYLELVASTFALTILVASLSYRFLEQPCLKLKRRFTAVPSEAV